MAAERSSSRSVTGFVVDCSLSASDHKGWAEAFWKLGQRRVSKALYEANVTIPVRRLGHRGLSKQRATDCSPAACAPQSQSASQAGPIPDKPRTVVIPAGSVITVRLVSPLDPSSKTGDVFTAVVTGLIAVGGEVVVPSGVAARGQVIGVKANKKATEKARLKLALTSLTIDGTTYSIQTKLVTTKAQDNSKSTTATTSGESGASAESGLVFKLTAPVTVNRQRRGGTGQES